MTRKRITIELIGDPTDKNDVRLSDFIEQLAKIKTALQETEMAISGKGKPSVDYKVVDLKHSSPAQIVLEPVSLNGYVAPELLAEVPASFTTELSTIKRKAVLQLKPDLSRLVAYENIGAQRKGRKQNRIEKVAIRYGRKQITIDDKFKKNLDRVIGPDELAHGTISGMLDAINIHNTNRFTLYPSIGPKNVAGTFPSALRGKVKKAIGLYVTVIGNLRYKAWAKFPHGVTASDIDIHELDSELPTLSDLRGAFAGSLDKLNSVEFIDKLRDEDW